MAGNCVLLQVVTFSTEPALADVVNTPVSTSMVMLLVARLACVWPAQRVHPADTVKEA